MEITTNKKINNFAYAPGIATYGGNGAPGIQGEHGNCIFFTSYNLLSGEDLPDLRDAIKEQRLPIRNGEHLTNASASNGVVNITRKYQNGDYFFDSTGTIFRLHDIDKLTRFPVLSDNYKVYFTLCGQIKSNNDANALFTITANSNKISLNQHYTGLDINNTSQEFPDNNSEDYALRIYGDNVSNKSSLVEILHATPFYNFTDNADLKLYYDGLNNVWHLDSEVPIVIDSEIQINDDNKDNINLDEYSSVIISETPITKFYNLAQNISYKITTTTDVNKEEYQDLELKGTDDIIKELSEYGDKIYIKVQYSDNTYVYAYNNNKITIHRDKKERQDTNNMLISLIYNIEVYINKAK